LAGSARDDGIQSEGRRFSQQDYVNPAAGCRRRREAHNVTIIRLIREPSGILVDKAVSQYRSVRKADDGGCRMS
jgi:hypothetical protein